MGKIFSTIWKGLEQKGKFATLIGFFFAAPANAKFLYAFFQGVDYSRESLLNLSILNGIAMIWFILPSSISIKGHPFEIVIKD